MEANDASLSPGDANTRAQELRASLGARQDAESMLAEAGRIRQEAAASADALVDEAQQLSAQLVRESRELAEKLTTEARERADGILARSRAEAEELADRARATADAIRAKAETEVEEYRRRVRAEVTDQVTRDLTEQHRREVAAAREQSEGLVSDLEASVRILSVSLESAVANVSELMASLDNLRSTSSDVTPGTAHGTAAGTSRGLSVPESEPEPRDAEPVESPSYDVDNPAPATTVPSPVSQFRAETDDAGPEPERPRSATEAFLSSSSLEVEQSSQELRDLQQSEEARRRRGDESRRAAQRRELEGLSDDDPNPAEAARPLGWLFRSAQ
jgi:hypothetical protein